MHYRSSGVQQNSDFMSDSNRNLRLNPSRWQFPSPAKPIRLSNSDGYNGTLRVEPYVWGITLSECSKYCGLGYRTVSVYCHSASVIVDDSLCDLAAKPRQSGVEQCNVHNCIGTWKTEEWGPCSASCAPSFATRAVICVKLTEDSNLYSIINYKYCNSDTRPKQLRICSTPNC